MGDQDSGSPGRPVSFGLQVPGELGHCARTRPPLVTFPRRLPFKISFNCTSRDGLILRLDSLAILKVINKDDAVLIPKNGSENSSSGFLHSEFYSGAG